MVTAAKTRTHKWGQPIRFQFKTERSCVRPCCDLVKVTRHEPGQIPWCEWWRNGERIIGDATPPCDGEIEVPAP